MEEKLHTARTLVGRLRGAAAAHDGAAAAEAAAEVRRVTKEDPEMRAPLADAGAVPFLAAQLSAPSPSPDAAAALLNISISARERVMSTPGVLDALTAALRFPGSGAAARHAAATVHSLLCAESHRGAVGARRPLVAALVALLRTRAARRDALRALFGVALHPPNRAGLVALGAAPPLFALVADAAAGAGLFEDATAVLAQVAGCPESLDAFGRVSGVRTLLDLVESGTTPRARENAAAALLNLVVAGGDRAVAEVVAVGGAEDVVRDLAEDAAASARGKAKAEALLRALEAAPKKREHRLADFLDGLVLSDPYISSPSSASTQG